MLYAIETYTPVSKSRQFVQRFFVTTEYSYCILALNIWSCFLVSTRSANYHSIYSNANPRQEKLSSYIRSSYTYNRDNDFYRSYNEPQQEKGIFLSHDNIIYGNEKCIIRTRVRYHLRQRELDSLLYIYARMR